MAMPDDLKDFRASNGFAILSEDEAAYLIAALFALALLGDLLGWLA